MPPRYSRAVIFYRYHDKELDQFFSGVIPNTSLKINSSDGLAEFSAKLFGTFQLVYLRTIELAQENKEVISANKPPFLSLANCKTTIEPKTEYRCSFEASDLDQDLVSIKFGGNHTCKFLNLRYLTEKSLYGAYDSSYGAACTIEITASDGVNPRITESIELQLAGSIAAEEPETATNKKPWPKPKQTVEFSRHRQQILLPRLTLRQL